MSNNPSISFIDLQAQQERIQSKLDAAMKRVLEHGQYIMGPEVREFETRLADFCGTRHAISCANGTDALVLVLRAWDIGPGDAVFVPSFTFVATAEAVVLVGATPIFVDVDEATFNLCPASLEVAADWAVKNGFRAKAVIPVDLFGLPADHKKIEMIAARYDLLVLDDSAQGFGGSIEGCIVGSFGHAAATSFFPAKPLGCYGDGGAILTNDDLLAAKLLSVRMHGKGKSKYENITIGMNSRLDTLQAAILLEKLNLFGGEIAKRNYVAERYQNAFAGKFVSQRIPDQCISTWAQFTLLVEDRENFIDHCRCNGVPTQCYYPIPLHRQIAYKQFPVAGDGCPTSEKLSAQAVSIPMHSYLEASVQDYIIEKVLAFVEG